MSAQLSYAERADLSDEHPLKNYLLYLISVKKTNLCVSADVNNTSTLLRLAEEVGDYICVLKTHADIVDDFGERTIKGLKEISARKKFLIFEDRKFGDIGSTVQQQYTRGPFAIASWAHIVNAHMFPGPTIVTALKGGAEIALKALKGSVSTEIFVGTPAESDDGDESEGADTFAAAIAATSDQAKLGFKRKDSVIATTTIHQTFELSSGRRMGSDPSTPGVADVEEEEMFNIIEDPPFARGLLLFAQMSSEDNMMDDDYTERCVEIAQENTDFVMGFISQRTLNEDGHDNFISMAPGVKMPQEGELAGNYSKGDGFGQQYRTPELVIGKDGCDIIIVGRGIIAAKDKKSEAERYRKAGWKAYEARLRKGSTD